MNSNLSNQRIRPLKIEYDAFGFADASVLLGLGNTKVFCNITLQKGVPSFLRGQGVGWLTAEYAMLPSSTQQRSNRESMQKNRSSRSVEISRLIGRSIRSVVNLRNIGEKTIVVDCEVFQADGGTRTACITAASCALELAEKRWIKAAIIEKPIFNERIAAISVGIIDGNIYLDLNQNCDMKAQADFNFILTESGKIIEIQGTAEKQPISVNEFDMLHQAAFNGVKQVFGECSKFAYDVDKRILLTDKFLKNSHYISKSSQKVKKDSLFSLGNRLR